MDMDTNILLAISGMLIGLLFGIVIQRSRFCMTAVVSNWILMRDTRQLKTYLISLVIAVIGTISLENADLVAIADSAYRHSNISWHSVVIGGCIFGLGAVFAGGCIGRILVLTGEGNLGALLALMTIALGASAAYTGALESLRLWLHGLVTLHTLSNQSSILALSGISTEPFLVVAVSFLAWLFVRTNRKINGIPMILTGVSIGLLIVAGWWVTGWLLMDEFSLQKPASLTFAGPITNSALYLTTGSTPQSVFGITLSISVILGSLLSALSNRSFHIQSPDADSILRILSGGFLMGVGAIMARGCNIGQGLTGMSTLSIESIFAVIAIFAGMYAGVKWLQYGEEHGSFWAFLHLHAFRATRIQELRNTTCHSLSIENRPRLK